jgi:prepilin-type N-terminal cleavage/methylation domain-containing protein
MGRARAQSCRNHESGFTLVEIMVAITILLIGVLGVVTMVSAANKSSATTHGRQNATSLVRRLIETARAVPYRTLKGTNLPATLQAQSPDLADSNTSDSIWTVQRGGFTYTLATSICVVDDAADGYGAHNASDPAWCSDSSQTGTADTQPNDYKRLTTTTSWTIKGQTKTLSQATLIPSTGQGDLPSTTSITPSTGSAPITSAATTSVSFAVAAVNSPASLSGLVGGQTVASCPPTTAACSGGGAAWNFTWSLGSPVTDTTAGSPNFGKCIAGAYTYDSTYNVSARGYTAGGLTGDAATVPVTINRCAPIPPPNFNATGDKQASLVDIEWTESPEDDVTTYKVFRGNSFANLTTQVCSVVPPTTSCIDPNPPTPYAGSTYYYGVYAYDTAPNGSARQGALGYINVDTGNKQPLAPLSPAAALNPDGSVTLTWTVPSPEDPDSGDSIASFRIYRRAGTTAGNPTYLDRYDYDAIDSYCGGASTPGATCSFTDTSAGGSLHTYNITSVDTHLLQSPYTTGVTR